MSVNEAPPRHLQQDLFGRILDAWGAWKSPSPPGRGKLSSVLDGFSEQSIRLVDQLKGSVDIDLAEKGIWMVGPVVQKGSPVLFPVATASVWGNEESLSACLRVALIAPGDDSATRVWGWRFDSAEQSVSGNAVARPHAHAQPTTKWFMTGVRCLLHPHQKSEGEGKCSWGPGGAAEPPINETHPAFPLRGETLPGLALAFVVSLYGSPTARAILETDPSITRAAGAAINADFAQVLGTP